MYNMSKDFEEEEPKFWDLLVVVVICSLALLGSWVVFVDIRSFVAGTIDSAFVTEGELRGKNYLSVGELLEALETDTTTCSNVGIGIATCESTESIMSRIEALEASIKN